MIFSFFTKKKAPAKLPFLTDIHCHIVPGVDDGSPDAETSVRLLSHMHDWGIERVFASPHSTQDTFENTPQSLAAPFAELKSAVEAASLPVQLAHHAEYRLDEFFIEQFRADNLLTLPGNHLLIENSFSQEPWNLTQLVFDINLKGYVPILAHPERYLYYSRHHRERYEELSTTNGLLFQINLLSLTGGYGKTARETALYLLRRGMVQFIGTDIHSMRHVEMIETYMASRTFKKDFKLLENLRNDSL